MRWLMPISIIEFYVYYVTNKRGLVAQWITRLPTEQKIPGSSPGKVDISFFFSCIYFCGNVLKFRKLSHVEDGMS